MEVTVTTLQQLFIHDIVNTAVSAAIGDDEFIIESDLLFQYLYFTEFILRWYWMVKFNSSKTKYTNYMTPYSQKVEWETPTARENS